MRNRVLFSLLFTTLFVLGGQAQESWTLERCINHARENSLTMKQASLGIQNAELTLQQDQWSRWPTLNIGFNGGMQFGRTIDPVTNSFDQQNIGFNSYSLNTSVPLFTGNRINSEIQQSKLDLQASRLEADATFNTLALNIAQVYLQILLSEEQLANARRQLEQSNQLLEQTDKLIRAGALPVNDRLEILSQVAMNEQSVVQAQNAVESNYLSLKQFLELDPTLELTVAPPPIDFLAEASLPGLGVEELFNTALGTQPQIEASDLRKESAEKGVAVERAGKLPTVNLIANINTNWSSVARNVDGTTTTFVPITFRDPMGNLVTFEIEQEFPSFVDYPYADQLNENLGQVLAVNVNVPILNGRRAAIRTQQAELGVLSAKLDYDQARQTLKTDVQRAIADARASEKAYRAAKVAFDAADIAFQNAQTRFDLGAINTYAYTQSKLNRDMSEVEMTRAKYQYIFSLKVLDFYMGKDLRLN
jgi:outer membrane protein